MPSPESLKTLSAALILGLAGLFALPAAAQQADMRLQGTIEKLDSTSLLLQRSDGTTSAMSVSSGTAIFTSQPSSLSAIKPGDFIASAAVKGADGKLRSKELRIFPEALRGLGEGQRPMDAPQTLMTNAAVSEVVAAPEGDVIKVKYKDGTADLVVGPQVPIKAVVASEAKALKTGEKVFVLATKGQDGTLTAKRIIATN